MWLLGNFKLHLGLHSIFMIVLPQTLQQKIDDKQKFISRRFPCLREPFHTFKHSPSHPCRQLTPLPSWSREPRSQSFLTQDSVLVSVPRGCWWKMEVRGEGSTWISSSFSPNAASLPQAEPGLLLLDSRLEATAASAQNDPEAGEPWAPAPPLPEGAPPHQPLPPEQLRATLTSTCFSQRDGLRLSPISQLRGVRAGGRGRGRLRSKTQPIRNLQ